MVWTCPLKKNPIANNIVIAEDGVLLDKPFDKKPATDVSRICQ